MLHPHELQGQSVATSDSLLVTNWLITKLRCEQRPAPGHDQRHDLGLANHGHGVEIEAFQGLARGQAGLVEVACDAAPGPLGNLVFGQGGEEAR